MFLCSFLIPILMVVEVNSWKTGGKKMELFLMFDLAVCDCVLEAISDFFPQNLVKTASNSF